MRRSAALLAFLVFLGVTVSAAQAVLQDIRLGDRVSGPLGVPGMDVVELQFFAVAGTLVDLSVACSSGLEPSVGLRTAAGVSVDVAAWLRPRGRKVQLRRFPLPTTGTYRFEMQADSGSGECKARSRGRFPRRVVVEARFPDEPIVVFDAMPGAVVSGSVRAERGASYEPMIDSVSDAGGDLGAETSARRSKAAFGRATAEQGGAVSVALGGSGGGDYLAKIKIRTPGSSQTFDLSTPPPVAMGSLAGTVLNASTGQPLAGVTVLEDPPVAGVVITTDANGAYAADLPVRRYTLTFSASNFQTGTRATTLVEGAVATVDVSLDPVAPVLVDASVAGDPAPGGTVTASATVDAFDGSTVQSVAWTQTEGAPAMLVGADMLTVGVTLPDRKALKDQLIHVLSEPPVEAEDLPPNVPLPPGEFTGGLPDRFQVVGVNPFALEEAGLIVLEAEVTTSSGSYHTEVEIHTPLPWKPAPSLRSVPIGRPVLLHGRNQVDADGNGRDDVTDAPLGSYDWSLVVPAGSGAALLDATAQSPDFTPDVAGTYEARVTDPADGSLQTLQIIAGNWRGVITGIGPDGLPLAASCTGCHDGSPAPDKFTPWRASGHAEILTQNLNTSSSYTKQRAPGCFSCHTVGYDPEVDNGGADDAPDYAAFLDAGLLGSPSPDNWAQMVAGYPATAGLSNVQCESCHGPQNTAHRQGSPRIDISSNTCAPCHGEPLRHARFQQWQLSAHANYELALEEGESGSCARCHTGNGFLAWLPILLGEEPGDPTADITVTWTADEIHPQTCATCHDPHAQGTTSNVGTNATVRITDDTPLLIAGFQATDVGRGAICMTCHNSRRGLRNDATYPDIAGTTDVTRAPHGSSQADVLMGQNAYLVNVGDRGPHSRLQDACVACHMVQTPPPAVLSYNLGGTNHTFFASPTICSDCHGPEVEGTQHDTETRLDALEQRIVAAILDVMADQIAAGNVVDLGGDRTITSAGEIAAIAFGESRGRQAITVTFTDASVVGPVGVNSVTVRDAGSGTSLGTLYDFADPVLPKSGWNWGLVHNDGSRGVHNPAFARLALDQAIQALDALPGP